MAEKTIDDPGGSNVADDAASAKPVAKKDGFVETMGPGTGREVKHSERDRPEKPPRRAAGTSSSAGLSAGRENEHSERDRPDKPPRRATGTSSPAGPSAGREVEHSERDRPDKPSRRAAGTSSSAETPREKKEKCRIARRIDTGNLPTPPPDPVPDSNIFDEAFAKHKAQLEVEALRKEGEFLDYLMGLPTPNDAHAASLSRSASVFATSLGAEDAFDHLDKLYTLMEQVLNLREQNNKLSRRVRELELLRSLRSAHLDAERAVLTGEDIVLPDEDADFAESLLSAMLSAGSDVPQRRNLRLPTAPRQRSRSVGIEPPTLFLPEVGQSLGGQMTSKRRVSGMSGTPKVSKWTKVKAAFKWERAYTGGIGEATEVTRYLKVPENVETPTFLTRNAELSAPSTPGTLSSSSSTEDVIHGTHKNGTAHLSLRVKEDRSREEDPSRRSHSLDGDVSVPTSAMLTSQGSKDTSASLRKNEKRHKTPWGKVKNMINLHREGVRRQPARGSIRSEDGYSISSLESSEILQEAECGRPRIQVTSESPTFCTRPSNIEIVDLAARRLTPTLTITVPSSEELRSISSPESISPPPTALPDSAGERSPSEDFDSSPKSLQSCSSLPPASPQYAIAKSKTCQDVSSSTGEFKRQQSVKAESLASSPKMQRHDSKWNKVKKAFLTNATSVPPSPSKTASFFDETDGWDSYNASAEDLDNDVANLNIQAEIQRNYQLLHDKLSAEFYRKLTEWEKLKSTSQSIGQQPSLHEINLRPSSTARERDSVNLQMLGEEHLTPEFKKKLQEWKRIKKSHHSPSACEHQAGRRRKTEWQLWRSPSKPETKSDAEQNRPHLSDDFIKKMEEWKKIKAGRFDDETESGASSRHHRNTSKQSKGNKSPEEIQCWERQLTKVEREQQKIERQRDKFLDREARLSKLRRVVSSSPQKKEVLVHTSTGFYRFEGISRKFTRKLYEWEKSQGISPESSTFRLLNLASRVPSRITTVNISNDRGSHPVLKRSVSMGSMVEGNTKDEPPMRQPSSLSLNDMEELEAECMAANSRIDSEPMIAEDLTDEIVLDDSEPEAMIVDIEDVIEETASPMTDQQPHQTPIYCVAASETTSIAVPLGTVTSSHEPSPVILMEAGEVHPIAARATVKEVVDEDLVSVETSCSLGKQKTIRVHKASDSTDKNRELPVQSSKKESCAHALSATSRQQDFLAVLDEMKRNEGRLRNYEVNVAGAKSSPAENTQADTFTGRPVDPRTLVGVKQIEIRECDAIATKEEKMKDSFKRQIDLCRQLLKKMPRLEEFDEERTTRLRRLVEELKTVLLRRYEDTIPTMGTKALRNTTGASRTTSEKDLTGVSFCHQQRIELLLSTIQNTFEAMEARPPQGNSEEDSIDEHEGTTKIDNLHRQSAMTTAGNEIKTPQSKRPGTADQPEDADPSGTERPTGTKKRINARRRSSTEDEDVVITVDRDSRQKRILKTRRLTDTQVGYKWKPAAKEHEEDPDNRVGNACNESTVKTVSAFRDTQRVERIIINEDTLNKIVVRTANIESRAHESSSAHSSNRNSGNFSDAAQESPSKKEKNGPKSVFVKTKRMIFSPFRRDSKGKTSAGIEGEGCKSPTNVGPNTDFLSISQPFKEGHGNRDRSNSGSPRVRDRKRQEIDSASKRPPLPQSPVLSRKEYHKSSPKEAAPSIRMMIQRYNQKLEDAGSPASSGSGSPIWRSPSSERRVRLQMEKYQEEVRKAITGPFARHEVQKSASTSVIRDDPGKSCLASSSAMERTAERPPLHSREILKSTSADFIGTSSAGRGVRRDSSGSKMENNIGSKERLLPLMNRGPNDKLSPALIHKLTALSTVVAQREGRSSVASSSHSEKSISACQPLDSDSSRADDKDAHSLQLRALKIRRAKEDFLSRGPGCYSHDPQMDRIASRGETARGSRAESADTEILRLDLIKSASAGMINVDPDTFERLSLNRGCESLPRSGKRCSAESSSGRLSQIASKFRRARLRRAKEKEGKMSTVSMLCRQSLLVDIQPDGTSKSCPSTPAPQRDDDDDYTWLKRSRDNS